MATRLRLTISYLCRATSVNAINAQVARHAGFSKNLQGRAKVT